MKYEKKRERSYIQAFRVFASFKVYNKIMLIWFTIRQFSLIAMMPDTKKTVQFRMYKISTARDCSNLVFRFYWERKTILLVEIVCLIFQLKIHNHFFYTIMNFSERIH